MKVIYYSVVVVFLDQITKLMVKGISIPFLGIDIEGMKYASSIDIFGSFFRLTFVENPGMAFGFDLGDPSKLFLSLFSIVASIGIFYYIYKIRNQKLVVRVALALILGGAVGNLIDRTFYGVIFNYAPLFYGKVVDFFNVDFFDFSLFGRTYDRWPIFNIADAAVTVGVFLLIFFHKELPGESSGEELISEEGEGSINHSSDVLNSGDKELTVENNEVDEKLVGVDGQNN